MSPEVSTQYRLFSFRPEILSEQCYSTAVRETATVHLKGGCNNAVVSQVIPSYHIVNAKYVLIQQEYGERAQRIKIHGECSGVMDSFYFATMFTIEKYKRS